MTHNAELVRVIEAHKDAIEQARRNVLHGWGDNGMAISEALVAILVALTDGPDGAQ